MNTMIGSNMPFAGEVGECPNCHYHFAVFRTMCPQCGMDNPMPDGIYLTCARSDDLLVRRFARAIRSGRLRLTKKNHG